jgi:hypothetical protein
MRELLIVVDHKQDRHDRWILFQTTFLHIRHGLDNDTAVREHCTELGMVYRGNGYPDRLRVRGWAQVDTAEWGVDLEALEPTTQYIYPPMEG